MVVRLITEFHGVKLITEGDMVLNAEKRRGFEPKTIAAWKRACAAAGTVVDAGAYTGFYSFLALISGAECAHAFEPSAGAHDRLLKNAEANGLAERVTAYPLALWSRATLLSLRGKGGLTSGSSMLSTKSKVGEVQSVTLDSFSLQDVTAIKIDVERAEMRVLSGAKKTLQRCRPTVFVELLNDTEEVTSFMKGLGYTRDSLDPAMYVFHG